MVGDDVMVISGLLSPDLGVWWTQTTGGSICVSMVSDTHNEAIFLSPAYPKPDLNYKNHNCLLHIRKEYFELQLRFQNLDSSKPVSFALYQGP